MNMMKLYQGTTAEKKEVELVVETPMTTGIAVIPTSQPASPSKNESIPNINRDLLERLNIGELEGDLSSSEDSESEISQDAEPLIIQLMESMFTRKKTVEETTHMIS